MISLANDEFGDFQTPIALTRMIASVIGSKDFDRVLEPTCGVGNFLRAVREQNPHAELKGVEVQEHYAASARSFAEVVQGDAMRVDFGTLFHWESNGHLLVVGNPPWVTNAALTALGSDNKPTLRNIRGLSGLDAMTGSANFDIAEAIILKLVGELSEQSPTIAMLCKTQVARNVLSYCDQFSLGVRGSKIYEIDAKKWFNASVDACLFVLDLQQGCSDYTAEVFVSLEASLPTKRIGMVDGLLVSDVDKYIHTRNADSLSPVVWRQGIKHDATKVMELVETSGPHKKTGESVQVEEDHLFPLLKCTDVFRGRTQDLSKWMVVPQRHTGDDTTKLKVSAPQLWAYLNDHGAELDGRKSSIYRKRSRFCIFGVGEYSFAPYKVAISAMHKQPIFRLVGPINGRPVVFDDVCYFSSFASAEQAAVVCAILQSKPAQDLIESLCFTDSKRPITKKLLQRVDLYALLGMIDHSSLLESAATLLASIGEASNSEDLEVAITNLNVMWSTTAEAEAALFPAIEPQLA